MSEEALGSKPIKQAGHMKGEAADGTTNSDVRWAGPTSCDVEPEGETALTGGGSK